MSLRLALILLCIFPLALCIAQAYNNETKDNTNLGNEEIMDTGFNFISPTTEPIAPEGGLKLEPGMEVVKVGGVNILVPKGAKVQNKGSWISIEDLGEYLGRKFDGEEKRLDQLEKDQEAIKAQISQIKTVVDQIYKRVLNSQ